MTAPHWYCDKWKQLAPWHSYKLPTSAHYCQHSYWVCSAGCNLKHRSKVRNHKTSPLSWSDTIHPLCLANINVFSSASQYPQWSPAVGRSASPAGGRRPNLIQTPQRSKLAQEGGTTRLPGAWWKETQTQLARPQRKCTPDRFVCEGNKRKCAQLTLKYPSGLIYRLVKALYTAN